MIPITVGMALLLPAAAAWATPPKSEPTASTPTAAQQKADEKAAREADEKAAQEAVEQAAEQKAAEERAAAIAEATATLQARLADAQQARATAQKRYDTAEQRAADAHDAVTTQQGAVVTAQEVVGRYARAAYQAGPTDLTMAASLLDSDSPQDLLDRADSLERVGVYKDTEYDAARLVLERAQAAARAADAAVDAARQVLDEARAQEHSLSGQIANIALEWSTVLAESGAGQDADQARANARAADDWATYLDRLATLNAPSVTVAHVRSGKHLPPGVRVSKKHPGVAVWTPRTGPRKGDDIIVIPDQTQAAVTHAVSSLGAGYKWRTNSAAYMDCSALVDRSWNIPGLPKNKVSDDRPLVEGGVTGLAETMTLRSARDLTPGDVVFYVDGKHGLNHAGIAVTDRTMIAADAATGAVNAVTIDRDRVWKVGRLAADTTRNTNLPHHKKGAAWQCGADPNAARTLPTGGITALPGACPAKPDVFAEAHMQPAAIVGGRCAAAMWPQLQIIGGWRPSDPYPDHPSGRALDIMLPGGCSTDPSNTALGDAIASHFMNNAGKYQVQYIIWHQRIWNAEAGEAPLPTVQWRGMSNRGSCTANHMDHVHVSFIGPNVSP